MSAPDRPLLLEQPFTRANPRLEGTWSHSFDVPEEWNLPRGFRDGVRVYEAVANDDLGAGILETSARARERACKGGLVLAVIGRRNAVIRDGHAIANVRQATAESLVESIRVGLRRVPALVERELDGEAPVSVLEELAALDLVEDAAAGDADADEILEARSWVWSGGAGRRGALLLRLLDAEIERWSKPSVSLGEALEKVGLDREPDLQPDVWRCRECTFRGPLVRFDRDGGFACPTCSSRRVTSGP